jgi:hypothetical protein
MRMQFPEFLGSRAHRLRCNKGASKRPDNGGKEADLIAVRGQDEIEKPVKTPKYQAQPARFRVGDGLEPFPI